MLESDDLLPVSERVAAPPAYRPEHPEIAEWRPASLADVDTVTALVRAIDGADHPEWLRTRAEVEEHLGYSFVDLPEDTLLGFTAAGEAVALGVVTMPPLQETIVRVFLEGGVHPGFRGRGVGRVVLAWALARAERRLSASDRRLPAWVLAYEDERTEDARHLLARNGFRTARYFFQLERDLSLPVPRVEPVGGVRIVPYAPERSASVLEARTDSFRDHWGSQPMSDEQWEAWTGGTFRPDVSFLALAGDEVVGFCLCQVSEEDWVTQGFSGPYIAMVGTTRAWRGKRIAPALLGRTMEASAALGWEKATLSVDAENPSGALGLYTGMGFVRTNAEVSLVREY
jgi:ribosomal protein S18 acetylase RimI-like enzyme